VWVLLLVSLLLLSVNVVVVLGVPDITPCGLVVRLSVGVVGGLAVVVRVAIVSVHVVVVVGRCCWWPCRC